MPSFQIAVSPSRRAAARFIGRVRRQLVSAVETAKAEKGIRQTDIARVIDVHRSVINRQLNGREDMSLGRVAEIAWAMGLEPKLSLEAAERRAGQNWAPAQPQAMAVIGGTTIVVKAGEDPTLGTDPLRPYDGGWSMVYGSVD